MNALCHVTSTDENHGGHRHKHLLWFRNTHSQDNTDTTLGGGGSNAVAWVGAAPCPDEEAESAVSR